MLPILAGNWTPEPRRRCPHATIRPGRPVSRTEIPEGQLGLVDPRDGSGEQPRHRGRPGMLPAFRRGPSSRPTGAHEYPQLTVSGSSSHQRQEYTLKDESRRDPQPGYGRLSLRPRRRAELASPRSGRCACSGRAGLPGAPSTGLRSQSPRTSRWRRPTSAHWPPRLPWKRPRRPWRIPRPPSTRPGTGFRPAWLPS